MAEKSKEDYNKKEVKDLIKILREKEKKYFDARIEFSQRKIKDVHVSRKIRKEVARIKTTLQLKKLKGN